MNRAVVFTLLIVLGVALGIAMTRFAPETREAKTVEWLENPRSLGTFDLETQASAFNNQSLVGRWTIVAFGFLNCPDVCPTSLAQLAALAPNLSATPIEKDVAFVFVSVDPQRDSVAEIDEYVRHFDSSILGVTGNDEQLSQFASALGIQYKVPADVSARADDYAVAHSITFSIIGPAGMFRGRFRPGFDTSRLARDLLSESMKASPARRT